jgi:opacity protein-like surface antigen
VEFKIILGGSLSKSTEPITVPGIITLDPPRAEYASGFVAGGGIEFPLTASVSLEADALFLQKGSRIGSVLSPTTSLARINELSIPVLVKVRFLPGTSPYLLAGPELAFVLSDGPKNIDYGVVAGIGFQMKLRRSAISLEARYHYGSHDLRPDDLVFPVSPDILRKTRAFVFMLGIAL